ncbi:hypothetical protein Bpfe_009713, partial [Biomphalaria pfeifferi]
EEISQTEKAKFGELCQYSPGRLWFSRYVNSQRVHNKRVTEPVFFRLMQYFAVCLFECKEAEDFSPAKTLMTMCFTFYYEEDMTLRELGRPMAFIELNFAAFGDFPIGMRSVTPQTYEG